MDSVLIGWIMKMLLRFGRCGIVSIAMVAMLTVVPRNLLAQSAATNGSELSDAQLNKIVKNIEERNTPTFLDPKVANLLGLTKSGPFQYRGLRDDRGSAHGFVLLAGTAGYLVTRHHDTEGFTFLHVDSSLRLISAVFNPSGQPNVFSIVPISDATKTLHEELLTWADIADRVIGK